MRLDDLRYPMLTIAAVKVGYKARKYTYKAAIVPLLIYFL
jgi:hypothetical protein